MFIDCDVLFNSDDTVFNSVVHSDIMNLLKIDVMFSSCLFFLTSVFPQSLQSCKEYLDLVET